MKNFELKEQKRDKKYGEIGLKPGGGAKRLARTKDGARANLARHREPISGMGSPHCRGSTGQNIYDGGEEGNGSGEGEPEARAQEENCLGRD